MTNLQSSIISIIVQYIWHSINTEYEFEFLNFLENLKLSRNSPGENGPWYDMKRTKPLQTVTKSSTNDQTFSERPSSYDYS